MGFFSSKNTFAPKLSIKLQEKNFLLWNQQVEEVILSHKLHKMAVNPHIPPMFKSESDRNIVSEAYEEWMVHDQALFMWLLSIIWESVLPRLLSCKHAYKVWDKGHKHYNAQMKAMVHQMRVELKMIKKDDILQGLPEEYNPFIMMAYIKTDQMDIYEVGVLLYVQEAQLDKYRQELAAPSATTNVVQGAGHYHHATTNSDGSGYHAKDNAQSDNKTSTVAPTQANAYLAHQDQLQIPQELESHAWNNSSNGSSLRIPPNCGNHTNIVQSLRIPHNYGNHTNTVQRTQNIILLPTTNNMSLSPLQEPHSSSSHVSETPSYVPHDSPSSGIPHISYDTSMSSAPQPSDTAVIPAIKLSQSSISNWNLFSSGTISPSIHTQTP
ncbi:hypothetical protein KIW84_073748 [Lathyrus oleraceus]|uniref:Retrovirus-related Pol polyprotein from transposon TNT 1-94 n=1 Tax=Pisum sativum TaxID=3888 RepID=A0A9D4VPQ5_PEA|nr:hypothetical protein KIW84_073748 [Pisum sativum]